MLIGKISIGSGLGDSLFTYITTRVLALDKGWDFGFVGIENFKGSSFLNLDWGKPIGLKYHTEFPSGKLIIDEPHNLIELNTSYFNPEVNFIEDGTVIDATCAQDERYWGHRLNEIREWLSTEPMRIESDVCVISLRGGEFRAIPDLILPKSYWDKCIKQMKQVNPDMKFIIHTDDLEWANILFPEYEAVKDIGLNWRSIRYAKYAVLSNSAFGIIPSLIGDAKLILAPRWWARYNLKTWINPQNWYKRFKYVE